MIYVDELRYHATIRGRQARRYGNMWCHLFADTVEELHEFAHKIGLRRGWFQDRDSSPHYDLTPARRERALQAGAAPISTKEWLRRGRHHLPR